MKVLPFVQKMLDFHLWFCLVQIRGLLFWDLSRVSGAEYFSSDSPTSLVVRNDQESLHQSWSYRDLIIRVWLWREGKQWRVVSRVNKVLGRLFYFSFLKWERLHMVVIWRRGDSSIIFIFSNQMRVVVRLRW